MIRFPVPLIVVSDPVPLITCRFIPENWIVGFLSTPEATYFKSGRIEISFSCSAFSLGKATLVPELHVPVEPPDVTAPPVVVGTHKKTEEAARAEPATPRNTTP